MSVGDIVLLLEFCLKNTYFSFQGQFYEQVKGAAIGSPVSPIIANLYMEYFEQKALSTASHPARLWHHCVDDTFVIQKEENKQNFLQHINIFELAIQFTVENNKEDGAIPFLDTIVKPENDGKLAIAVYRKHTHTETSAYSGTATIISQQNIVSLVPSPIGPKQSSAILISSKKKWGISGKLLSIVNTPSGLWTRCRKDIPDLLVRSVIGLTARVPEAPSPTTSEV